MNGAGNDFVVFDAREQPLSLSPEQLRYIANRSNPHTKGCDQIIVMESSPSSILHPPSSAFMRIFNADGSEVEACGNATRCIGWLLMQESGTDKAMVQTKADMLACVLAGDKQITVDMGEPRFAWDEIPLSAPCNDTLRLEVGVDGLPDAAAIGMGNPHVIFFTEDDKTLGRIAELAPQMQRHPLFSTHGVNVTIAHAHGNQITSCVWERGVGVTQACGTAACATAVAAVKRGYAARSENITVMQGGDALTVRWVSSNYGDARNNRVFLTGPVEEEFVGQLEI